MKHTRGSKASATPRSTLGSAYFSGILGSACFEPLDIQNTTEPHIRQTQVASIAVETRLYFAGGKNVHLFFCVTLETSRRIDNFDGGEKGCHNTNSSQARPRSDTHIHLYERVTPLCLGLLFRKHHHVREIPVPTHIKTCNR